MISINCININSTRNKLSDFSIMMKQLVDINIIVETKLDRRTQAIDDAAATLCWGPIIGCGFTASIPLLRAAYGLGNDFSMDCGFEMRRVLRLSVIISYGLRRLGCGCGF